MVPGVQFCNSTRANQAKCFQDKRHHLELQNCSPGKLEVVASGAVLFVPAGFPSLGDTLVVGGLGWRRQS